MRCIKFPAIAVISGLCVLIGASAEAQSTPKAVAEAAKRLEKPLQVMQTADALGMWRGVGPRERLDQIVRAEFKASGILYTPAATGPWAPRAVKSMTYAVDYSLPASRVDMVVSDNGKDQRLIHVALEKLAWDEATLGAGAAPTKASAVDRLNVLKALPHSFMHSVVTAKNGDVRIGRAGGKAVISVVTSAGAGKATIGAGNFPEKIEIPVVDSTIGKTTLAATYSGYKDWDGYEVFFPSRISMTLGGKPYVDLAVTDHAVGSYLVWPVPDAIAQQASK